MQIVIKLSDETYKDIKEENGIYGINNGLSARITGKVVGAIQSGTPLPKGHGRLGDLDALEKEIVNGTKAGNYEEGYETFAHINDMDDCIECVKYADTIIEADKTRDCNNCAYSDQGRCAGTEVCHECMWSNKFIEADKGSEDKG